MNEIDFLILDDDPVFCQTLARALQRRHFTCLQCHTIAAMTEQLTRHRVNRAVIDLKIGEDNGLQAIRTLIGLQPECEILMLTGFASIATAIDAIKAGALNYLPKPASADEILKAFDSNHTPDIPQQPPSVNRLEWEHIQRVLQENGGNISATARALNMHRRTLQRKLAKRPVQQ
ncbi:response regulator [Simiduia sp. 21SJ11W-1]|uniref:response regulator transcription factor n=1 Tax=Simiduia sp. 21SJ11W-1 TaxID=2909669 RepID=UPI0020A02DAE|nr:response regulator [Simiduia sp. 21SJ11W-1]UTA47322.1 response regulator [Simiduia sp. 21SJ11W-1]